MTGSRDGDRSRVTRASGHARVVDRSVERISAPHAALTARMRFAGSMTPNATTRRRSSRSGR